MGYGDVYGQIANTTFANTPGPGEAFVHGMQAGQEMTLRSRQMQMAQQQMAMQQAAMQQQMLMQQQAVKRQELDSYNQDSGTLSKNLLTAYKTDPTGNLAKGLMTMHAPYFQERYGKTLDDMSGFMQGAQSAGQHDLELEKLKNLQNAGYIPVPNSLVEQPPGAQMLNGQLFALPPSYKIDARVGVLQQQNPWDVPSVVPGTVPPVKPPAGRLGEVQMLVDQGMDPTDAIATVHQKYGNTVNGVDQHMAEQYEKSAISYEELAKEYDNPKLGQAPNPQKAQEYRNLAAQYRAMSGFQPQIQPAGSGGGLKIIGIRPAGTPGPGGQASADQPQDQEAMALRQLISSVPKKPSGVDNMMAASSAAGYFKNRMDSVDLQRARQQLSALSTNTSASPEMKADLAKRILDLRNKLGPDSVPSAMPQHAYPTVNDNGVLTY